MALHYTVSSLCEILNGGNQTSSQGPLFRITVDGILVISSVKT